MSWGLMGPPLLRLKEVREVRGVREETQRYLRGCEMTLVLLLASLSPGLTDVTYKVCRKFARI